MIGHLTITGLRNIEQAELDLSAKTVVVYGNNGSGKTSLLEALYLLGMGRSFRTPQFSRAIGHSHSSCSVVARLAVAQREVTLGVERPRKGSQSIRLAGEAVHSIAPVAEALPLQLMHVKHYQLLQAAPAERRRQLDWAMFHVKPSFYPLWLQLMRIVKQRNAALKSGQSLKTIAGWDQELLQTSLAIDLLRQSVCLQWFDLAKEKIAAALNEESIDLQYHRGWHQDRELAEVIANSFERDCFLGYTQFGAHRADFSVTVSGKPAHHVLSLGQQKLLLALLLVAQVSVVNQQADKKVLLLIDDLPTELDRHSREIVLNALGALQSQLVITCIEAGDLAGCFEQDAVKMFHVEQGMFTEKASKDGLLAVV